MIKSESGKDIVAHTLYHDSKGLEVGLCVFMHDSVTMRETSEYSRGDYHGVRKTWYTNGQQSTYSVYEHGRKNGIYLSWDLEGRLNCVMYFCNGKRHGEMKRYSSTGDLFHKILIDDHPHCTMPITEEDKFELCLRHEGLSFIEDDYDIRP